MHRLVLTLSALVCLTLAVPSQAQQTYRNARPSAASGLRNAEVERPGARPLDVVPVSPLPRRFVLPGYENTEQPGDTLSEAQILLRLSRIYNLQSQILAAEANEDLELAEQKMELAMTELGTLLTQPDIMERPHFQELYRTVITSYERFYGVSADTLSLQFGDIFQLRADMFAVLNDVDEPLLEDVMSAPLPPVRTTVPMTMNRLVEQSIAYLKRSPQRHLYNWMSRAETYFPMIEQILREEGVPDELKYLAMIESGLNPRARSWAQAGGMWQFIVATGSAYGLKTDSWVDERADPEKATRAAARHLKDLYELFDHDWQLALAGYNCSPSRIKRAIARAEARLGRKATFWDIYNDIPKETRNYVPMFIATALVASNPEAFDIDVSQIKPGPKYAYHYVPVHGGMPLATIAELAGTDVETIKALNPELRRSTTPPSRGAYYVRIPLGTFDRFAARYAELPKETRQLVEVDYTVRRGDTLNKIAKQHGVTVTALMRENNLRSTTLRVGQRLTIPTPNYEVRQVELVDLAQAEAFTVEYGERSIRPIKPLDPSYIASSRASSTDTPVVRTSAPVEEPARTEPARRETAASSRRESESHETRIVYHVRRGDNLTAIARKYGVSVDDLRRWNNLRDNRLLVGQRLYLYEQGGSSGETASNTRSTSSSSNKNKVVYQVRRGDTLSGIAAKYGVSMDDIRRWNNLRGSDILSGQRLTIYSNGGGEARPSFTSYRVRRGDTLTEIARKYGVSVQDLKSWNGLRSSTIRPGQTLKIRS